MLLAPLPQPESIPAAPLAATEDLTMRTLTLALTTSCLALVVGCGGGSSVVTPTPDETSRENAVALAGDVASIEVSSDSVMAPMMGQFIERPRLEEWDACTEVTGDRATGGTITYTDCDTPRGTLNGTVTWTPIADGRTLTRDLTFTRESDGQSLHLEGTATWTHSVDANGVRTIHRTGDSTATGPERTTESSSDLTWTYARTADFVQRSYPTGTIDTQIFEGGELVKDVHLEFNGTSIVTATVDGETYTYDLTERRGRPRHQPRPGRTGPRNR